MMLHILKYLSESLAYVIGRKIKIIALSRVGTEIPAFLQCNLIGSKNSVNDNQVKRFMSCCVVCHDRDSCMLAAVCLGRYC